MKAFVSLEQLGNELSATIFTFDENVIYLNEEDCMIYIRRCTDKQVVIRQLSRIEPEKVRTLREWFEHEGIAVMTIRFTDKMAMDMVKFLHTPGARTEAEKVGEYYSALAQ